MKHWNVPPSASLTLGIVNMLHPRVPSPSTVTPRDTSSELILRPLNQTIEGAVDGKCLHVTDGLTE